MTATGTMPPAYSDLPESTIADPAVRVCELTKRFSARPSVAEIVRGRRRTVTTVVNRVSFDVHVGEVVGVLGPNGAGKTTIFKMLSTMVLPDDGTATVCSNDIWREAGRVRAVLAAVSSDERSLNWRISARENLLLFAALHRIPRREAEALVASTLQSVGLAATDRKMVAAFSSGMRQRLLIARALLARPKVLLLDEPTRALDPISAEEFRQFLREELIDRQRCTIVLATHNADEALNFCDRVIVLNRGRVLATGTAAELKARFSEERYRILTARPDHPCFHRLESDGLIRRLTTPAPASGEWYTVEYGISGGHSCTAEVIRLLAAEGVRVAGLERVEPSLANLIANIIADSAREQSDA